MPTQVVAVAALVVIALAVRFPYLWEIPRLTDESQEVLRGLGIARGQLLPLTNVDPYIGPLWNYILAAGFLIGGPSLYTARTIVAVLGALTVIPTYLLARDLARSASRSSDVRGASIAVGLLTGAMLALSPVHIAVNSHIAWSNCLTPLFTTFGFWLLHGAVTRDRPRRLLASALFLALAAQTHPTAVLLLPGALLFVLLSRRSWLRTPWPSLAAAVGIVVYSPIIVEAARQQFSIFGHMSDLQAKYAEGEALSVEVYFSRLGRMFHLVANSLGGALSEFGSLVSPFQHLPSLGAVLVTLGGLVLTLRRRSFLPVLLIASLAVLLPAVSPKYEAIVPKARYVAPLLPICYALMALIAVDLFTRAGNLTGPVLAGPTARLGIAAGTLALILVPLGGLRNYYETAVARGQTNTALYRTVDAIGALRRPGERVVLDRNVDFVYTLGGGHLREHLLLAGRMFEWPLQTVDIPRPGAVPPRQTRGLLVLREGDEHRVHRYYLATPLRDAPTELSVRLYRMEGIRPLAGPVRAEPVVPGVSMPAGLAFAPDGRLFFNEVLDGRVRIWQEGALRDEPFVVLPTTRGRQQGALGLALDPDFASNRWVYVFYSEADGSNRPVRNRVVRFTEVEGRASEATAILGDLPINATRAENGGNNGGALTFGPDGKLYVSVGEVARSKLAPDPERSIGKILRINRDGSTPGDNPFPGLLPYAVGFRNVWGMAFNPANGRLYATDNGSRGFDEVNLVLPGLNYGYPAVEGGRRRRQQYFGPLWHSGETRLGIAGAVFYSGKAFPEYYGDLFYCSVNTGALQRIRLHGPDLDRVALTETVTENCRLDVANAPDGSLYFSDFTTIYRLTRE